MGARWTCARQGRRCQEGSRSEARCGLPCRAEDRFNSEAEASQPCARTASNHDLGLCRGDGGRERCSGGGFTSRSNVFVGNYGLEWAPDGRASRFACEAPSGRYVKLRHIKRDAVSMGRRPSPAESRSCSSIAARQGVGSVRGSRERKVVQQWSAGCLEGTGYATSAPTGSLPGKAERVCERSFGSVNVPACRPRSRSDTSATPWQQDAMEGVTTGASTARMRPACGSQPGRQRPFAAPLDNARRGRSAERWHRLRGRENL